MRPGWEELTDEFDAVSADGKKFHILVYTTIFDESAISSQDEAPPAELKRICTSDGQDCNQIDEDTFEIVDLGFSVKRQ